MTEYEKVKNVLRRSVASTIIALVLTVSVAVAVQAGDRKPRLGKHVLAVVNGNEISTEYFDQRLEELPEAYREEFDNDRVGFLDRLILESLLVSEAADLGLGGAEAARDSEEARADMIEGLFSRIAKVVSVTDEEVLRLFSDNREKMGEYRFEQVKDQVKEYLLGQKRQQSIGLYIRDLQDTANIVKNEKWVAKQVSSGPEGLLREALKSGKPSVIDFGSDSCVPCKMMKPILEDLKGAYSGKAHVIVIDIYKNRRT